MCHQHLSFSDTSNYFFLTLLDISSPFRSMCLPLIFTTPGSIRELKSNCWCSLQPPQTQSRGFYVISWSDCMHSELLEVSVLEPGQIAMPHCSGKDLQKTHPACPERTYRASCFGDQEFVWNSLRQELVFKSSARITPVAQLLPLVATYTNVVYWKETVEGLGKTAAGEARQLVSISSTFLSHCINLNSNLILCLDFLFRTGLVTFL